MYACVYEQHTPNTGNGIAARGCICARSRATAQVTQKRPICVQRDLEKKNKKLTLRCRR